MRLEIIAIMIFSAILLAQNTLATSVQETFYVTFNDLSSAHIVQALTIEPTSGYYLEPLKFQEAFPSTYENLKIHDGPGVKIILVKSTKDAKIYEIKTPKIESGRPFAVYYEYDYQNARIKYKKNFDIELLLANTDRTVQRKVIFCLPKNYQIPVEYEHDSTIATERALESSPGMSDGRIPSEILQFLTSSQYQVYQAEPTGFCDTGAKVQIYPQKYEDMWDIATYRYSVPNADKFMTDYEGARLTLRIPKEYDNKLSYLKNAEKTAHYIDTLGLKRPYTYSIEIVDSHDKAFSIETEEGPKGIACFADNDCFVANNIFRFSNEIQTANIVKTMMTSAFVNTYGSYTNAFWEDGAIIQLTINAMHNANLDTAELEASLKVKDLLAETQRTYEAIDFFNTVEKACPNHVEKSNNYLHQYNYEISFLDSRNFNNFLLFTLKESCGKDLSSLFNNYNLNFDRDITKQIDRYLQIKDQAKLIPKEIHITPFLEFIEGIDKANKYFVMGDMELVRDLLSRLERDYEKRIIPSMELLIKYKNIKNKEDNQRYNLFKFVVNRYLSAFLKQLSNDEYDLASNKLALAERWTDNGPRYTQIGLPIIVVLIIILAYYMSKRRSQLARTKHTYKH